jgi:mRNA interferase YafQ
MKTIPITELRQRAAEVIAEAGSSDEPTVVLQRSRKVAYIVSPERFEREQDELRTLRRALFLAEVREVEAEYAAGKATEFDDMEALLDDLRGRRMRVTASSRFLRRARKLRSQQAAMLRAALRRFAVDPRDPLLRTHKLKGDLAGYWAFSVDNDLRVLLRWDGDVAFLVNLGTHDEVY